MMLIGERMLDGGRMDEIDSAMLKRFPCSTRVVLLVCLAFVRMVDCYSNDAGRQALSMLCGERPARRWRNAAKRWRKGRPSDVYKGNEDLTGLYKDEDLRTPKTLSGCKPNGSQKGSAGLTDLFKDTGLPTLQRAIYKDNDDLTGLYKDEY